MLRRHRNEMMPCLHLEKIVCKLTAWSKDQAACINGPVEGSCKPDLNRYGPFLEYWRLST